jgi:cell division protein FtsL
LVNSPRSARVRRHARVSTSRSQPARANEPRPILKTLTKIVARALLGLVILAVFVFGVFPTGSYLEQRNELDRAVDQVDALKRENENLESRVERLESDEEIERVARNEFDMVLPNEESYLILPPGG